MRKKLMQMIMIGNFIFFIFYFFSFRTQNSAAGIDWSDKIIKVRGLVVVDSLGIERVIVGAHLPEPTYSNGARINARRKKSSISGVMLYDAEGQERGGYVTDDSYGNAFLTLDSKTSQQFLLIAEPQGAAAIQLWSRNGKNKISLLADDDDAAIDLLKDKKTIKLYENDK